MLNQYAYSPIIWVGGKRTLMKEIVTRLPQKFNNYYEPFFGGGALYFYLKGNLEGLSWDILNLNKEVAEEYKRRLKRKWFVSDLNTRLINMYQQLQKNPYKIIALLKHYNATHDITDRTANAYFYKIRKRFNKEIGTAAEKAAMFLYLNRMSFNGLYAENSKGEYNASIAKADIPDIVRERDTLRVHRVLQNTSIKNTDFTKINPKKGDFVYFDPPYFPKNKKNGVLSYTKEGFVYEMQEKLRNFMDKLDRNGVYFLVSNSDVPESHEIYKDYKIELIPKMSMLSKQVYARKKINEVLVRNY